MNSQDLRNLQEAYLNLVENVPTGKSKRARFGGIAQRPSAREVERIKAAARRQPTLEPESAPRPKIKRKGISLLGPGGQSASAHVLRGGHGRTPGGIAQRRATELNNILRKGAIGLSTAEVGNVDRRMRAIKAALKRKKLWGTPEARAEEVILGYLIDEGYADCIGSAEIIFENMSDEWFDEILNEAKWG
jgi:hypothetical protein